jgi:hypothetical protein
VCTVPQRGGTLLDFEEAVYVLGSVGSKPSYSRALAESIPHGDGDGDGDDDGKCAMSSARQQPQRTRRRFLSTLLESYLDVVFI